MVMAIVWKVPIPSSPAHDWAIQFDSFFADLIMANEPRWNGIKEKKAMTYYIYKIKHECL